VRIFGLASSEAEYRTGRTGVGGALNSLFGELSRHATVVDVYQPVPSALARARSKVATWARNDETWRRSYKRHEPLFQAKSARCRAEIDRRRAEIDVVLQWEFFFAPTDRFPSSVPYCVYNDWTTALIEEKYPHWLLPRVREGINRVQGQLLRNAAYVFTFTDLARDSVIKDYGVDPARAVTAWAGANLAQLPDVRRDTATDPVILLVGNDYRGKGVDVLIRAMGIVRETYPTARAIVVGGTGQHELGAVPAVELRPNASKDELDKLYRQATLFVLPTRAEAFGHAFAEAMAYRLPCIGSNTGGVPEVIDDGRTGYLVPVGDHHAVATRIMDMLARPDRMREMGDAGRQKVEERFTWDRVVDRMLPYLKQAAAGE
jgi:glycosyltransferase involved in cell wall biosynthesis